MKFVIRHTPDNFIFMENIKFLNILSLQFSKGNRKILLEQLKTQIWIVINIKNQNKHVFLFVFDAQNRKINYIKIRNKENNYDQKQNKKYKL